MDVDVVQHPPGRGDIELGLIVAKVYKHPELIYVLRFFTWPPVVDARLPCAARLRLDPNLDGVAVFGSASEQIVTFSWGRLATPAVDLGHDTLYTGFGNLMSGPLRLQLCGLSHTNSVGRPAAQLASSARTR
jgi:hypothetical protein